MTATTSTTATVGGGHLQLIEWTDLTPSTLIGHGTFSAVYKGVWKRPGRVGGRDVALKVMTRSRCAGNYDAALQVGGYEPDGPCIQHVH
jgi:hypothetical protein